MKEIILKHTASILHRIACKAVETEARVLLRKGCNEVFFKNIMFSS